MWPDPRGGQPPTGWQRAPRSCCSGGPPIGRVLGGHPHLLMEQMITLWDLDTSSRGDCAQVSGHFTRGLRTTEGTGAWGSPRWGHGQSVCLGSYLPCPCAILHGHVPTRAWGPAIHWSAQLTRLPAWGPLPCQGLCLPPLWVRRDSGSSLAMSQVIVGLGRQPAFKPELPCLLSGTSCQRQLPGAGGGQ